MTEKMNKRAIILFSGGLDCTVALSEIIDKYEILVALTVDYGQEAFKKEEKAVQKICKYYSINHKILELYWYKRFVQRAKTDWLPNRNNLLINIAACYLDDAGGGDIIIGANKQEAQDFSDNSIEFIKSINKTLKYSCNKKVKVIAPLIDKNKDEIVALGLKNNAPLNLINSCYNNTPRHCGKCNSCKILKKALKKNKCYDLISEIFD